jgi:hypothetical protein
MDDSPSRLLEATVVLRTRAEISPRIYQENRKGEDILCSFTEIRNPTLRDFRVDLGTETRSNQVSLVALVLKGCSTPLTHDLPSNFLLNGSLSTANYDRRRSLR